jgi:hypothetical protein
MPFRHQQRRPQTPEVLRRECASRASGLRQHQQVWPAVATTVGEAGVVYQSGVSLSIASLHEPVAGMGWLFESSVEATTVHKLHLAGPMVTPHHRACIGAGGRTRADIHGACLYIYMENDNAKIGSHRALLGIRTGAGAPDSLPRRPGTCFEPSLKGGPVALREHGVQLAVAWTGVDSRGIAAQGSQIPARSRLRLPGTGPSRGCASAPTPGALFGSSSPLVRSLLSRAIPFRGVGRSPTPSEAASAARSPRRSSSLLRLSECAGRKRRRRPDVPRLRGLTLLSALTSARERVLQGLRAGRTALDGGGQREPARCLAREGPSAGAAPTVAGARAGLLWRPPHRAPLGIGDPTQGALVRQAFARQEEAFLAAVLRSGLPDSGHATAAHARASPAPGLGCVAPENVFGRSFAAWVADPRGCRLAGLIQPRVL